MKTQEQETRKRFNLLKPYYDATWDPAEHTLHVGLFRTPHTSLSRAYKDATMYLIKQLHRMRPLTAQSRILDIGCGAGRTLIALCEQYDAEGVGIDMSDKMIQDAKAYVAEVNARRVKSGMSRLRIRFIRGSGSELDKILKKNEQFTHIISQDAILLMQQKQSVFQNISRLLVPGGALGSADFVSETPQEKLTKEEQQAIYLFINWKEGLSYQQYQRVLSVVGLTHVTAEQRNEDMIRTYELLIKQVNKHPRASEPLMQELVNRYQHIVDGVRQGTMGWGLFWAQKPERKRALIAGTHPTSIGRYIGTYLHTQGWEVWLYGLHAKKINKPYWHERRCDISDGKQVQALLQEIPDVDLVLFLADSGGHGELEELDEQKVTALMNAKLTGSLLLSKALMKRYGKRSQPMQFVWCAGKPFGKPKDLIAYSMVNTGLWAFIQELNTHYHSHMEAYYLPTPLISPSPLGDQYIQKMGKELKSQARSPQIIVDALIKILDGKEKHGMLELKQEKV